MDTTPTTQTRSPSDDRRAEIARIAAALFDERGLHETSMDDIAQEVGLKKPTLYHYFKGKSEIVYLIHKSLHTEFTQRLQLRLNQGIRPAHNLREVIFDIFDIMGRYPGHLRVFFENHRNLPEEYKAATGRERTQYYAMVKSVISDGIRLKELRDLNPELTALALFGMCNWSYQWYRPNGPMRARDIAEHFWEVFILGVASPGWLNANARVVPSKSKGRESVRASRERRA